MTQEENRKQMVETLANAIVNQLSINGLIEAAKFYSVHLANDRLDKMSEAEKEELINKIKKAEEESQGEAKKEVSV
jgi:hypothetical protein